MDVTIKAVHFTISEKLEDFTTKKVSRAIAKHDEVLSAKVIMKLIKPETNNNKEVEVVFGVKGSELFAKKTANTFEEALDLALDASKKQLIKYKQTR